MIDSEVISVLVSSTSFFMQFYNLGARALRHKTLVVGNRTLGTVRVVHYERNKSPAIIYFMKGYRYSTQNSRVVVQEVATGPQYIAKKTGL